ncbi:hypothetical protein ACFFMP_00425 [Pseudoroseomonas cervicalis]|uniref:hypothetical protein n=1 Tax=Teichococcus cervicalis TaxID=204525 RepID=UPI0035E99666
MNPPVFEAPAAHPVEAPSPEDMLAPLAHAEPRCALLAAAAADGAAAGLRPRPARRFNLFRKATG